MNAWEYARMSPMQRTLAYLREHGYDVIEETQHWHPFAKRRIDLFGFCDVMAANHVHLLAIQVTYGSHHAAMVHKIMQNKAARTLCYYMDIQVWSWSERGEQYAKKQWTLRKELLTTRLLPRDSLRGQNLKEQTNNETKPTRGKPDCGSSGKDLRRLPAQGRKAEGTHRNQKTID